MASLSKIGRKIPFWKNIFRPSFKSVLFDKKYLMVPAFEIGGRRYFMFDSQTDAPTGRQMASLAIYNEMNMRCTREYLELHTRAMEKLLSDPKKINVTVIGQLNVNLKERLDLMPLPEFVWKLGSVVFLDEHENPYTYDYELNEEKIKFWKGAGMSVDFFSKTPLAQSVPWLQESQNGSQDYTGIGEAVEKIHRQALTSVLSD